MKKQKSKSIKERFKNIFKKVDELFFPPNIKCLGCGVDLKQKQDIELCDECVKTIEFLNEDKCCEYCGTSLKSKNVCSTCSSNKRYFDVARSVATYESIISKLIIELKYHNRPYIKNTLAHLLFKKFDNLGWNVDLVIPVPLTKRRQRQRGFNQSLLIAKEFCNLTNLTLCDDVLLKSKESEHQANLGYFDRQENIKESFKLKNKSRLKNKVVLLIDDVLTTGATASACSKVLKEGGAKFVFVLTVASTKYENQFQTISQKKPQGTIKIKDYLDA